MDSKKRIILFLICCITIRSILVVLAKYGSNVTQNIMAVFAVIVSLGFMSQFLFNSQKPGAFGGKPWWNSMRPVHALLYMTFAFLIFTRKRDIAWIVLLIDVVIGAIVFTKHYAVN
jgi:hypothetical protein